MPAIVLIGAQWGDEGKGKATDLLGGRVDYVVKFNGGNNAGHTVVIGDEKYALHLLPVRHPHAGRHPGHRQRRRHRPRRCCSRRSTALDARGVDTSKLLVSANAHVITPYHRTLDKVTERFLGKPQIGTTGRGIGPTYADKINRDRHPRPGPVRREASCARRSTGALEQKNQLLVKVYNRRAIDVDEVVGRAARRTPSGSRRWSPTPRLLLDQALDAGETVLLEGGQATLLDVDHGTYPFVTSSNATAGGACTGSGIAPTRIDRVIGDRQGVHDPRRRGPVPDRAARRRAASGCARPAREFGTTTGRPRRCGWFDAVDRPLRARGSTASPTSSSPSSTC